MIPARSAARWLCIALLLLALGACDDSGKKKAADAPEKAHAAAEKDRDSNEGTLLRLSEEDARRAGLKVEKIELKDAADTVAAFGTVEANRNRFARVVPPVDGRITKIAADLGDHVEAGQTLAVLESPELGEARSAYQQAQVELDLAKASLDRAQRLVQEGSSAKKDLLSAKGDHERAQAKLNAASAKLTSYGASVSAPRGMPPDALAIAAPFGGTVVERTAVLGEYAQSYQSLFTIADLSSVWIETNLYDRDIGSVAVGALATVSVGAYPDRRFAGKLTYISSLLDKETRTAKARIEAPNPDGRLKPGMFADALIEKATKSPELRLPDTALVLLQGQMTAFVAEGDGFEPRPVETGARSGDQIVIKSGLEPGDEVVVSGAYALKAYLLKSQISAD